MNQLANYSVLQYFPYPNREEHVYVGILVATPGAGVRVHIAPNLRKAKALDPAVDLDAIRDLEGEIPDFVRKMGWQREEVFERLGDWTNVRPHQRVCQFVFDDEDDYQRRIQSIMESLVMTRPAKAGEREPVSRLFRDLKSLFIAYQWIGRTVDDIHKHLIVPRYPISPEDGIKAEFAMRNGKLHIIETVDFRVENAHAKRQEAMSKALVFDLASKLEGASVCSYVVTAGAQEKLAKPIMNLIGRYSTNIFAWESQSDTSSLFLALEQATGRPRPPELPFG